MIIQKFGLEIRKLGSMSDLYKEVDMVLSKPVDVCSMTVAHAIQKMLKPDGYCDVCTIKNMSEITGVIIPKERLNLYQTVHCMHWSDMLPDYSRAIMCMILDDFRSILNPEVK
jgi:hypothetical protein